MEDALSLVRSPVAPYQCFINLVVVLGVLQYHNASSRYFLLNSLEDVCNTFLWLKLLPATGYLYRYFYLTTNAMMMSGVTGTNLRIRSKEDSRICVWSWDESCIHHFFVRNLLRLDVTGDRWKMRSIRRPENNNTVFLDFQYSSTILQNSQRSRMHSE